jgi:hypothetical protein
MSDMLQLVESTSTDYADYKDIASVNRCNFWINSRQAEAYRTLDGRHIARASGAALLRFDAAIVRSKNFLCLTTPDVVCGVKIIFRTRRQAIEFEKLLGTKLTTEW